MKLDENSPIPLYYQLENIIRKKIEDAEYRVGEKIPSERKLSEELNLSRMTVSKAISNLVEEGVLYRKRGQGTFVCKKKIDFFPGLLGFIEIMERKGMKPSSKVISQEIITPNKTICEKLQISENEKVILTSRLRLADNEIIAFEKSFVPYSMCSKLLEVDLSKESIYKCLTEEGHKPTKATQEVGAVLSDERLGELLKIGTGEPILKRERITYSDSKVIEFSFNFYRGDMYSMIITASN
ncbi:GntR family transcriptional regulator [Clostridium ganghwense]|uniref:GntR family transcriptional regulator n=1 Tax=Clostridium ganghwense TaxID=312089 RepID=A0ABT4CJQ0_9CLOT|nr:GntR family transcriptional regulator [Clostridium ganghwense]MCY6369272.1 GntR family transcriptional regulator [Clostridium ganghwense]